MPKEPSLLAKKPEPSFQLRIKADLKKMLTNLAGATVGAAAGQWAGAAKSALAAIGALRQETPIEERAWFLVQRSLVRAIYELVEEQINQFTPADSVPDVEPFIDRLYGLIIEQDWNLGLDFFERPEKLVLLKPVCETLAEWLPTLGLDLAVARTISLRLPGYFVFALRDEWLSNPTDYEALLDQKTPLDPAVARQWGWIRYRAWLQKQTEEPVFGRAFGLRQIYVPLRGYWVEENHKRTEQEEIRDSKKKYHFVESMAAELDRWASQMDRDDAVRVISGGPGSGKSTLAKIWAADIAQRIDWPVLFIPLHLFDLSARLDEAVGDYIESDLYLTENPLAKDARQRTLIIFDGLDELAMSGNAGVRAADEFVQTIDRELNRLNSQELMVKVLITGREVAVQGAQSIFRKQKQVWHLAPYVFVGDEAKELGEIPAEMREDQRPMWWRNYGQAVGKNYDSGLPEKLNRDELNEITAQPLLNYLVALAYEGEGLDFDKIKNINKLYGYLIGSVLQRPYDKERRREVDKDIEKDDFLRILQEIAVAAWHGDSRKATLDEIRSRLEIARLTAKFRAFEQNAKDGTLNLLTAFYFRHAGKNQEGNRTFEFTHKSFGEYLTARRIVSQLGKIASETVRNEHDPDTGWTNWDALAKWTELTGPMAMDMDLLRLVINEVALKERDVVETWQAAAVRLFNHVLVHGLPMEALGREAKFPEVCRRARNAEEALMAVLNACAQVTGDISAIKWPSPISLGNWINRIRGQRGGGANPLAFRCFSHIDSSRQVLFFNDLYAINLAWSDLQKADLLGANLLKANLQGANLRDAKLQKADLQDAILQEADLQGADLQWADLQGAKLQEADLQGANLQRADLQWAKLQGAILQGAYLQDAILQKADLQWADLQGADLRRADLRRAILQGANLQGADLQGADLRGADLRGADLRAANFQKADLLGADLRAAKLQKAILDKKQIKMARKQGAILAEDEVSD